MGRLITVAEDSVLVREYFYDDNGNRTIFDDLENSLTTLGSYDNQDRLLAYGNYTYTYTPDGAIATKTDTATSDVTSYTYDALGNLISVDLPDGRIIDYLVDGDQRRVMKLVDGIPVKGWLYRDDLRIVAELDGAGSVVSRFVWADGAGAEEAVVRTVLTRLGLSVPNLLGELLKTAGGPSAPLNAPAYMVRGGNLYRIVTDHLGTPRLVVDATTGTVAQRLDVDEWGNVTNDTNPGFVPFGFAAGLYDADTGLVRFGARDYDAETGRWTAKDSIHFNSRTTNLYGYVEGDPLNRRDQTGYDGWDVWVACAASLAACVPACIPRPYSGPGPECGNCVGSALADCPDLPLPDPPKPKPQPKPFDPCENTPDAGLPVCTGPEPDLCGSQ